MVRADPRPQLRCLTCGEMAVVDDQGQCVTCFDRRIDADDAQRLATTRRTALRMQEYGHILVGLGNELENDVTMSEAVRRVAESEGRTERTVYRALRQWRTFKSQELDLCE